MSCFAAAGDPKAFYELLVERVHSCFDLADEYARYLERVEAKAKRAKRAPAEAEAETDDDE